jgi:ABC-type tungstate transport system permease subunit
MLSENTYCLLTRAVGMCYTLLMSDITDVELVHVQDQQAEEHYLVLVGVSKYVLSYWPNTVLSNSLSNFKIISSKSLESIKNKIK